MSANYMHGRIKDKRKQLHPDPLWELKRSPRITNREKGKGMGRKGEGREGMEGKGRGGIGREEGERVGEWQGREWMERERTGEGKERAKGKERRTGAFRLS